ncbi:MAG TPA: sulfite exporter TauE/SafE family protein [Acidimicrobiales bacterium]|nr:sulfite exporter TauE/SafE family protein [Acidimicrobiales bacterium]
MHIDVYLVLGSAVVGFLVGLTGMGGGALMTPMLVLLFGVTPSAAIASDLMAALFMKPAGAVIHWRRKTVNTSVVRYLCYGSMPAAFFGTYVMHLLGHSAAAEHRLEILLGSALIIGSVAIFYRSVFVATPASGEEHVKVRPLPTVFIGVVGGFMVGLTSIGAGSLILVLLVMVYPTLSNKQLVGTDLVQSLPLTFSATLGTLMFSHVELGLTSSIVIGSVPAVIVGSLLSSRSNGYLLRRVITAVVLLSGLKYVGVPTDWLGVVGALEITLVTFLTIRHWQRTRVGLALALVPEAVQSIVTLLPTGLDGDL